MKPFLICLLLAGCAVGTSGFRDSSAPIGSTTRFDKALFEGDWRVVARLGKEGDIEAVQPERFVFGPAVGDVIPVRHVAFSCNDWECVHLDTEKTARVTGPGRFTMRRNGVNAEHWVLWVDADFRTAVIGSPTGQFGWIMEKGTGAPSPDRIKAARDVLDFGGFDLSQLREVQT